MSDESTYVFDAAAHGTSSQNGSSGSQSRAGGQSWGGRVVPSGTAQSHLTLQYDPYPYAPVGDMDIDQIMEFFGEHLHAEHTNTHADWHDDVSRFERHHVIAAIVRTIFPSCLQSEMDEEKTHSLTGYVRRIEREVFEVADDRVDYYRLLADKLNNIIAELDAKREKHMLEEEKRLQEAEAALRKTTAAGAMPARIRPDFGWPPPPRVSLSEQQFAITVVDPQEVEDLKALVAYYGSGIGGGLAIPGPKYRMACPISQADGSSSSGFDTFDEGHNALTVAYTQTLRINTMGFTPQPMPPVGGCPACLSGGYWEPQSTHMCKNLPPPANPASYQEWHNGVPQGLRTHLVGKLIKAIFPSPETLDMEAQWIKDMIAYCGRIENEFFEQARSWDEYRDLLVERISQFHSAFQTLPSEALANDPITSSNGFVDVIPTQNGCQYVVGGPDVNTQYVADEDLESIIQLRDDVRVPTPVVPVEPIPEVANGNGALSSVPPPQNPAVSKIYITKALRNFLTGKMVTAMFSNPHPVILQDPRFKNFCEFCRRAEEEMYAVATDKEDYYNKLASKIYKCQKDLLMNKDKRSMEQGIAPPPRAWGSEPFAPDMDIQVLLGVEALIEISKQLNEGTRFGGATNIAPSPQPSGPQSSMGGPSAPQNSFQPVSVSGSSIGTAQPVMVSASSFGTAKPVSVSGSSIGTGPQPVSVSGSSIGTGPQPVSVSGSSIGNGPQPVSVSGSSIGTGAQPRTGRRTLLPSTSIRILPGNSSGSTNPSTRVVKRREPGGQGGQGGSGLQSSDSAPQPNGAGSSAGSTKNPTPKNTVGGNPSSRPVVRSTTQVQDNNNVVFNSLPPPVKPAVDKAWQETVSMELRKRYVVKMVTTVFPNPTATAMEDQRVKDLVAYCRRAEQDFFEQAEELEEYFNLLAEKVTYFKDDMRVRKARRLEETRQQQGSHEFNALDSNHLEGYESE